MRIRTKYSTTSLSRDKRINIKQKTTFHYTRRTSWRCPSSSHSISSKTSALSLTKPPRKFWLNKQGVGAVQKNKTSSSGPFFNHAVAPAPGLLTLTLAV